MPRLEKQSVVVLCAISLIASGVDAMTKKVDCTKGQSISQALGNPAETLVIEITGKCQERVIVTRNNVTFLGSDPSTDGLTGPVLGPDDIALIELRDAWDIRFENLGFSNSENVGFGAWGSSLAIVNCRFENNGSTGAHFSKSSYAPIENSVFDSNGGNGLRVQREASVYCQNCLFQDNGGWAVSSWSNGKTEIITSQIVGWRGVQAYRS